MEERHTDELLESYRGILQACMSVFGYLVLMRGLLILALELLNDFSMTEY